MVALILEYTSLEFSSREGRPHGVIKQEGRPHGVIKQEGRPHGVAPTEPIQIKPAQQNQSQRNQSGKINIK
jgi:hypothetical protein